MVGRLAVHCAWMSERWCVWSLLWSEIALRGEELVAQPPPGVGRMWAPRVRD